VAAAAPAVALTPEEAALNASMENFWTLILQEIEDINIGGCAVRRAGAATLRAEVECAGG
jgi:hypothetical protein